MPIAPVLCVPLLAFAPLQLPLAVHDVGLFVADQLTVELCPESMLLGLTVSETLGALGSTCTDAASLMLPVSFEHVMVNTYSLMVERLLTV